MLDFLTFHKFITPSLLIFFYYIGALVLPVILFFHKRKIFTWLGLEIKVYWQMRLLFIAIFLFMELLWRICFETIIAYFHMHDALMQLSS